MAEAEKANLGSIGFPPDFQYAGLEEWKGLNTKPKRAAIDDQQCYWLENLFPIGRANTRAMYGKGTAIYTAAGGKKVIYYAFYNIGQTDYCAAFLDDGTAYQINVNSLAVTTISSAGGTFYTMGGALPEICQYGTSGILIVTTANANGYFGWDGSLYSPGGASPAWLSGLTTPLVLSGTIASGSTTITGFANTVGVQVGMWATGANIPSNTFVTGGTSTTVVISNAATGSTTENITFNWQMPTGIQGTSLDIYQGSVFIVNGTQRLTSQPGNGANFSASNGGVIAASNDSVLRKGYTRVISTSGYCYLFGDSSIFVVQNLTTTLNSTTNTNTTVYQYQNTDPQTGASFVNSVQVLGRSIIFVNTNGVYALTGNTATKISAELDGIWENLDTSVAPTCAAMTLYGIRVLVVNIRAPDYTGTVRNFMCCWDPNAHKWWIASQETPPTFIATQEVQSDLQAFGSDGTTIYPLFTTPSASINKIVQSKLYSGQSSAFIIAKQVLRFYLQLDPISSGGTSVNATIDTETSSVALLQGFGSFITFTNSSGGLLQFQNSFFQNLYWALNQTITALDAQNTGNLIGFTLTSTTKDFVIERAGMGYRNETALY